MPAMGDSLQPGGTMQPTADAARARSLSAACLIVAIDGLHPLAAPSRHWLLDVDEVSIRRSPGATKEEPGGGTRAPDRSSPRTLILRLPAATVSARHATVQRDRNQWLLRDVSSNGTLINGKRLGKDEARRLEDGDVIQVGCVGLVFRQARLDARPARLDATAEDTSAARGLQTMSPAFERELAATMAMAGSPMSIAILGETGTGKELTAKAIHDLSRRPGKLVPINFREIPEQLAPSEVFGYKRGAHNQADADKEGLVSASHKGTLFIDEIGDMPPAVQATMLRTLQDGVIRQLGATKPVQVDLRVVCATHVDVPTLISTGGFREDLWARVSGHVLELPALRDRREDLGLLVRDILARTIGRGEAPTISLDAVGKLLGYEWPRNIRQLEQVVVRAWTLSAGGEITLHHLPDEVVTQSGDDKDRLIDLLRRSRGDLPAAAKEAGVSRQAIAKRCEKHGVDYKVFRAGSSPAPAGDPRDGD
jgi:transcriptional regulator of acetoin/glycerol metabolism